MKHFFFRTVFTFFQHDVPSPPVVPTTVPEQVLMTASGFVIKPIYMILSLLIILMLRRSEMPGLRLIKWAMIAFLAGESFCALNFLMASGGNDGLEVLHGLGMVIMGALLPWGIFKILDDRVFRLTTSKVGCSFQRLCGRCWKRDEVHCGLQRLFLFLVPTLIIIALIPFSTPLQPQRLILPVFGTDVIWINTTTMLFFEHRIYPLLAVALLLITFTWLNQGPRGMVKAQAPFFLALGLISFSLMRYFLQLSFRSMPGWADWWEEMTELIVTAALLFILYLFRHQLDLPWRTQLSGKNRSQSDP